MREAFYKGFVNRRENSRRGMPVCKTAAIEIYRMLEESFDEAFQRFLSEERALIVLINEHPYGGQERASNREPKPRASMPLARACHVASGYIGH